MIDDIDYIKAHLSDHRWRLDNLYYVRDARGQKVQFKMNDTQRFVCDNLWYMNCITKARQLGMTTFFSIFYLDQILFGQDKIAGIIAHKQEDMKRIFRGKILFALNHLHPFLKEMVGKPVVDTANELVFENGGQIFVSLSTRSQTPNFLHISEYAYICAHDPGKADEILQGAVNSVHAGQMISIESTAAGRQGHFYNIVQRAENARKQGSRLTPLDFKSFFFPWYIDHKYTLPDVEHISLLKEDVEYFDVLERVHGIELTHGQKVWYTKKKEVVGEGITAEFPSTIEEAFSISLEGAYYAAHVGRVYQEKRIGFFPVDPRAEVEVAWDLGMNDSTVLVFFQQLGEEIRIVDHYSNNNEGLEHYVKVLADKKYRYGKHYLPHDAAVRDLSTGISREQFLWDLGVRYTVVAPKASIQDGIEKVRQIFHRFTFNEANCRTLLDSLQNYRKDRSRTTGEYMNAPRHDQYSHDSDAIRVLGTAVVLGGYSQEASGVHIESFAF